MVSGEYPIIGSTQCCLNSTRCFNRALRGLYDSAVKHNFIDKCPLFFRTVPSANTLVRRVNENAFASIVQARPCPAFGRPVHLRGVPPSITARYFSSCPSDSISRWTPCPPKKFWFVASGPPWLVSSFRFRTRLGFSIPSSFFGPRGVDSRVRI